MRRASSATRPGRSRPIAVRTNQRRMLSASAGMLPRGARGVSIPSAGGRLRAAARTGVEALALPDRERRVATEAGVGLRAPAAPEDRAPGGRLGVAAAGRRAEAD